MMKRVLTIAGVLILFGAVIFYFFINKKNSEQKFRTSNVERGNITLMVSATGTLNALTTVQVGTQVSGIISKLYADYNSVVKKGDTIAKLDDTFLKAQVSEAEANLYKANVTLKEAERNYNRAKELYSQGFISEAELNQAEANYESAKATVRQMQATLERAKTNLQYTTITAPIDGIVISRNVDVGQTVAASLQAPTLFTIAQDLRQMKLEASIDEADIGKIKENQIATFTVDAFPEERFVGRVSQIRLEPTTVQNVVTYTVIINVPNSELKLRPGMTANVSILIDRRNNVLRIPASALQFRPKEEDISPLVKKEEKQASSSSTSQKEGRGNQTEGGRGYAQPGERRPFFPGMGEGRNPEFFMRMMRERRAQSEEATVYILSSDKKLIPVKIKKGLSDGTWIEVMEGELKEGQEIVTGYTILASTGSQGQPGPGYGAFMMFRR
ncbi:MAG: efflux RND transporter periplasmic adaptor subunit [Candidatus Aminicenantia bacterium]